MMTMLIAAAAATTFPSLDWLTGYWLSCAEGTEVSETWNPPRGKIMRGSSMTVSKDGKTKFDVMRIAPGRQGMSFFAEPSGQPPAEFVLKQVDEQHVVFENLRHDFPQRIIYRREGDQLLARIEGKTAAGMKSQEWNYAAAPLNSNCPKQSPTTGNEAASEVSETPPAASDGATADAPPSESESQANAESPADGATSTLPDSRPPNAPTAAPDSAPVTKPEGGSLMGPIDEPDPS